jgi:signal transduction histidine kinase
VKDNGTGMDEKTRDRVFEPFFTTKDVGKGTGLGLSVTKEIVDRNGGRIEVDTTPGDGTTIILKFKKPSEV